MTLNNNSPDDTRGTTALRRRSPATVRKPGGRQARDAGQTTANSAQDRGAESCCPCDEGKDSRRRPSVGTSAGVGNDTRLLLAVAHPVETGMEHDPEAPSSGPPGAEAAISGGNPSRIVQTSAPKTVYAGIETKRISESPAGVGRSAGHCRKSLATRLPVPRPCSPGFHILGGASRSCA